jgi:jumonji domain-containing protein 7
LELKPLKSNTPWIPVNPLQPDFSRFPRFANAYPITVNEGEMLYLPGINTIPSSSQFIYFRLVELISPFYYIALWFHQVMQKGDDGVIAINYWYDMDYSSILYPTVALYRRLITGVMEGNRGLLKDEDEDKDNSE